MAEQTPKVPPNVLVGPCAEPPCDYGDDCCWAYVCANHKARKCEGYNCGAEAIVQVEVNASKKVWVCDFCAGRLARWRQNILDQFRKEWAEAKAKYPKACEACLGRGCELDDRGHPASTCTCCAGGYFSLCPKCASRLTDYHHESGIQMTFDNDVWCPKCQLDIRLHPEPVLPKDPLD